MRESEGSMSGYKTYLAGIGTILLGISQIALALGQPEAGTTINGGVQTVLAGLAVIGIGHKLEKAK